jgi:cellulose biosynthesis protein BcsQ
VNEETATVRFDDALPVLIKYVRDDMKLDPTTDGVFLRDGFGHIAFYAKIELSQKALSLHQKHLVKRLGRTAFPAGAALDARAAGATILDDPAALSQWIVVDNERIEIRLVDRRFFGRDWLATPSSTIDGIPPLMTFGSLKGGVGRTTALFVLAMHLARKGKNVLLIDLDLEAPGLAPLVFEGDERPRLGVLDYLVENGLGGISDADLVNFVGTSQLTDREQAHGRVDLAPATGTLTLQHPENMLAKLARGLVEDTDPEGMPRSLAEQIRELVTRLATRIAYDAVLVDARAGLAELTAGPLLGLGGNILLFCTDHPHTFEGYRYLMAHLATLPVPNRNDDWRERIRFVHAMAAPTSEGRRKFDDKLYEVLSETFYETDEDQSVFNFSLDDENAPHKAWRIFFDGRFLGVDPIEDRSILEEDVYKATFGTFIDAATDALGLAFLEGTGE